MYRYVNARTEYHSGTFPWPNRFWDLQVVYLWCTCVLYLLSIGVFTSGVILNYFTFPIQNALAMPCPLFSSVFGTSHGLMNIGGSEIFLLTPWYALLELWLASYKK